METRAHYVAVGAFVLLLVAVAFVAVLWLARAQLTTQYATYDVYFRGPVSGLREGAVVEYNGVPSGRVKEIRIDPSNVEQIRVTVEVENNVVIKQDAAANLETNLLSGVSYVQIAGGTQDAPVQRRRAPAANPGEGRRGGRPFERPSGRGQPKSDFRSPREPPHRFGRLG